MADDSGGNQFSELSLGIRELFRIVVPGAYALLLFEWLAPGKIDVGEGRTLFRIAISMLTGLIAYGFQVHEKWLPYSDVFNTHRKRLNDAIIEVTRTTGTKDYVSEYKYFLETRAPELKDRIHYFSSFYYMLDEMSLISATAAFALVFKFFHTLNPDRPISTYLVLAPLALQLLSLYWNPCGALLRHLKPYLRNVRPGIPKYVVSWLGILAIWLVWNWTLANYFHRMWPMGPRFGIEWRFWALMSAAVVFERLGAKQWSSIINEQVALVRDKNAELRRIIDANSSAGR